MHLKHYSKKGLMGLTRWLRAPWYKADMGPPSVGGYPWDVYPPVPSSRNDHTLHKLCSWIPGLTAQLCHLIPLNLWIRQIV